MTDNDLREIIITGIGVSPGICIGKAYLVDMEGVDIVEKYHISQIHVHSEIKRFKLAVKKAKNELRSIIENTPDAIREHVDILETHVILLNDKLLYGKIIETIEADFINAEWALKKVVSSLKAMFLNMSDIYLKERAIDIGHVSDRILSNLVGSEKINIATIDKRVVLVATDLSPAQTSQIQLERVKGFITDQGGGTSHTSIIARTLGIPAVSGLDHATKTICSGDLIIVDGISGNVIVHPSEQTLVEYEERRLQYEIRMAALDRQSHLDAVTLDGKRFMVMGNIELPEEIVAVLDRGGDGVGLYRTEFQYLGRPDYPSETELFEKYKDVVEVMAPRPVTIRTLDINGDKALDRPVEIVEDNPALGLRAIRYCLKHPDIFKTQLRAILRAAAYGNVRILFPMISGYEEIQEAKAMLDTASDELKKEGIAHNRDIEIGIMIEVPSAVILSDILADTVDFFSIGTNDLIQFSLAIDRGNRQVAYLYNPLHPAILRLLRQTVDAARAKGKKVFMCGEMAGDTLHIPILLGLGIQEFSMNPNAIPLAKQTIRSLNVEEARSFLCDIMKEKTAQAVMERVQIRFGQNGRNGVRKIMNDE
ncbi:MAG: phosphoenolpyruvate--protein phosphotransferase [Deltaproteobacteria bacterium]